MLHTTSNLGLTLLWGKFTKWPWTINCVVCLYANIWTCKCHL